MGQIVMTKPDVYLLSYWQYNSSGKRIVWTEANEAVTFNVVDLPKGAIVRRATLSATLGANFKSGTTKAVFYGKDVRSQMGSSISMRISVKSNRTVTVAISFKATPSSYQESGTTAHHNRWSITNLKLTIVYDNQEYNEFPNEPRMVLAPKKTVKLFAPKETDFTGNGLCILTPTVCTVTEEAGGEYELEMEHPIDDHGRWELLREDYIIEAPIPPTYIPKITMPSWEIWLTNKQTDLYSVLPSYTKAAKGIDAVIASPTSFSWSAGTYYPVGSYCTYPTGSYPKTIYCSAVEGNTGHEPTSTGWGYYWKTAGSIPEPGTSTDGKGKYNPGKIRQTLENGVQVYKLTDYNSTWAQVRTLLGVIGYVKRTDIDAVVGQTAQVTEPARTLYTQLFRIYEIGGEEDTHSITVKARHISYDLQRNCLYDARVEECEPATTIGVIQGSMINPDDERWRWGDMSVAQMRKILCDITEPLVDGNWSFQNPIQALLDPEEGLAGKAKAKVIRDNRDIFILDNSNPRVGIAITYGVNMRGVTWTRSIDELVTRIIPRAQNKDGEYIYIDNLYVDSDAIDEYAVISTEVLDSKYKEGQQIEHLDGTKTTLSLSDVMEKMLSEAEDRYYVDHCDSVVVSLDVEFLLLGDSEEYKQYRNLQRVQLYDMITVNTGSTRMRTQAQVSGYEWDCLKGRYNSISIGKVYSQSRKRLPGYRIGAGAITYSKLAPDLITYIKGAT